MATLYNDVHPSSTLTGLGFRDKKIALFTIKKVENYFDDRLRKQKVPGYSFRKLKPKTFLGTQKKANRYYKNQKMTRILAMRNRAKVMSKRCKRSRAFAGVTRLFTNWINRNRTFK